MDDYSRTRRQLALFNSRQLTQIATQTRQLVEENRQINVVKRAFTTHMTSFGKPLGLLYLWSCHSDTGSLTLYRLQGASAGVDGIRIKLKCQIGQWTKFLHFTFFNARSEMGSGISANCTLTLPRILPFSAEVFRYARNGDLNIIRSMFDMRKATPTDTTPDGASLLNVRDFRSNFV